MMSGLKKQKYDTNVLFLGLGGNIGDVQKTIELAEKEILYQLGNITKKSSIYKSKAWGNENQPDFLNKVIIVETALNVEDCLKACLNIEQKLGRIRTHEKWIARTIDIDLLFYNDLIINKNELKIPHPLLHLRAFVLLPLVEITPEFIHPVLKMTTALLLESCIDSIEIQKV